MNIIIFAPHPDDEILGCGGTIKKHVDEGDNVYVCVVTRGKMPLFAEDSVLPGLTCERIIPTDSKTWTWREQFENDIYYIENISLITDIKMVFAVLKAVVRGAEYRAKDTRVAFDGKNLDETRGRDEIGNTIKCESIAK